MIMAAQVHADSALINDGTLHCFVSALIKGDGIEIVARSDESLHPILPCLC